MTTVCRYLSFDGAGRSDCSAEGLPSTPDRAARPVGRAERPVGYALAFGEPPLRAADYHGLKRPPPCTHSKTFSAVSYAAPKRRRQASWPLCTGCCGSAGGVRTARPSQDTPPTPASAQRA